MCRRAPGLQGHRASPQLVEKEDVRVRGGMGGDSDTPAANHLGMWPQDLAWKRSLS